MKPNAQAHIMIPMSHWACQTITLMHTRSHILKIEMGGWWDIDVNKRTCNQCDINAPKHEAYVALEYI